jgi:hypothetical protein
MGWVWGVLGIGFAGHVFSGHQLGWVWAELVMGCAGNGSAGLDMGRALHGQGYTCSGQCMGLTVHELLMVWAGHWLGCSWSGDYWDGYDLEWACFGVRMV